MDHITTEGPSIIEMECPNGNTFTVSILSRRAAMLVMYKSRQCAWEKRMVEYVNPIWINSFILLGFQPGSGFHLGFKVADYDPTD